MSLKIVPFESIDTVSYSHSVATIAKSLAVLPKYTNVTDARRQVAREIPHRRQDGIGRAALMHRVARSNRCRTPEARHEFDPTNMRLASGNGRSVA